jgi:outer membrane receptor for ferrienterochelin and colicin
MTTDEKSLNEVVVVGYGTQKKRDLTGAISSISSKDIAETPASNVLSNAQGRLAGVDIVRSDGNPGPVRLSGFGGTGRSMPVITRFM